MRQLLHEQKQLGDNTDIESAEKTRISCYVLGDIESGIKMALDKLRLLAAEKGGFMDKAENTKSNPLSILHKHKPNDGFDSLAKKYVQISYYVFK